MLTLKVAGVLFKWLAVIVPSVPPTAERHLKVAVQGSPGADCVSVTNELALFANALNVLVYCPIFKLALLLERLTVLFVILLRS